MNQNPFIKNRKFHSLNRWWYVFLGIIIMLCLGTVYSYSVFRFPIEELFNIGSTQSGMPYMIALAFYAFFMFITGKYLNKYNPRSILLLGGFLVSIGWILSAYAPNIFVLTVTYGIISGAGVGIAYGVPITVIARWFPEKKGLTMGMVLIGFGLSPLITAPLARNLLENYGIMNTFQILGIFFGIIISILSFPFRYPSESGQLSLKSTINASDNLSELNTSSMIKSDSFKGLYINFMIGTTIGLMLIGLTSGVGTELIGLSPKFVATLMALFAISNGIGRPIFGWITDKFSSKNAMYLSYSLIIFSSFLILLAKEGTITLYFISFSIFWFNLGGWLAIAPTSTLALFGIKHYSQNYGVVFTAYGIGAVFGVLSSGRLIDLFQDYRYVFYYVIILCLIGILTTSKLIK
ncbi:MAG: OFA family MFS transporter [Erysipelotrichia bacterium]|nr:OFA family MFS transporter [Erysipelotrichia bacterium]MBS3972199.1 OFA family MFS transporter [Erysipelotrichia bacterium]